MNLHVPIDEMPEQVVHSVQVIEETKEQPPQVIEAPIITQPDPVELIPEVIQAPEKI